MLSGVVAVILLLTNSILAQSASVRDPRLEHVSKSFSGELTPAYLKILGFSIEKSSIEDVRKALGQAVEKQEENGPRQLCYVSSDPTDKIRVVFITGAMGGWETLTGFQVIANEAWDDSLSCLQTEKISKSIRVGGNLYLGVNINDLRKHLGAPTETGAHLIRWSYAGKQKMTQRDRENAEKTFKKPVPEKDAYFDTMSGIDVSEKENRVTSFAVNRVASF